jgi:hypothetical protein
MDVLRFYKDTWLPAVAHGERDLSQPASVVLTFTTCNAAGLSAPLWLEKRVSRIFSTMAYRHLLEALGRPEWPESA